MTWLFLFSYLLVSISTAAYTVPHPDVYRERNNAMHIKQQKIFQDTVDYLLDSMFNGGFNQGSIPFAYKDREGSTFSFSDQQAIERQVIEDTAAFLKPQGYYLYCDTRQSILTCSLSMMDSPEVVNMVANEQKHTNQLKHVN